MAGYGLDPAALEARIVSYAMRGGQKGAEYALERIKARAPVRKIFRGTRYRTRKIGGQSFREPRLRQVVQPGGIGADLDSTRGFLSKIGGETREAGTRITGHANSLTPLFRNKVGGSTVFLSGDFRRVDPKTGKLAKLEPRDIDSVVVRGGKVRDLRLPKAISARDVVSSGGPALSASGRYEVKSGRANFKGDDGVTRVGGRLRGELHIEGPIRSEGVISWFIVSRTKDGNRLYGRDQEFGNRHNRPHPFMRPGLHESRDPFRNAMRRAMQEGTRSR